MSDDEIEYEVESITKARLEKPKGKKKGGLSWKYQVRWKGYSPEDNTWEPVESFIGSEHFVEYFWERANTNGRDYKDTSLFRIDEEFFPTGPPRRKLKRKSHGSGTSPMPTPNATTRAEAEPIVETTNEPRKRSASVQDTPENRPPKRAREGPGSPIIQTLPRKEPTSIPLPGRHKKRQFTTSRVGSPRPELKKITRASSFDEIIPASDEEEEMQQEAVASPVLSTAVQESDSIDDALNRNVPERPPSSPLTADMEVTQTPQDDLHSPVEGFSNIPSHRARAVNPRVKILEHPNVVDMDGAITVKARLMGRGNAASSSTSGAPRKGSRPGPGRSSSGFLKKNTSSLLTFEKGALKTVKGRYRKPSEEETIGETDVVDARGSTPASLFGDEDEIPAVPPTAEELLELAGARGSSPNALPDFEDEDPAPISQVPESDSASENAKKTVPEPEQTKPALQQSLELAKDKLFPSTIAAGIGGLAASWKTSTIFGPLGLGSNLLVKQYSQFTEATPFALNIDPSVYIPVLLTDASSEFPLNAGNKGPPGKFYGQESTLPLLNTLRTGGPSAKVKLNPDPADEQKKQFESFCARLDAGEMFVAMAGAEVLAFCSSTHTLICQRLNISPALIGHAGDILVTRVIIENYSDYAALALQEARD